MHFWNELHVQLSSKRIKGTMKPKKGLVIYSVNTWAIQYTVFGYGYKMVMQKCKTFTTTYRKSNCGSWKFIESLQKQHSTMKQASSQLKLALFYISCITIYIKSLGIGIH